MPLSGSGRARSTYINRTSKSLRSAFTVLVAASLHLSSVAAVQAEERMVIGLGPCSLGGGWFQIRHDASAGFVSAGWGRIPWPAYNLTGGGLHLAAGDVDGDGRDELVAGLGSGSNGWFAVFDDASHGFALLRWIQIAWPGYNFANGEVWPAAGDLDGDGRAEIVAGLGDGGGGWLEMFNDASSNFAHVAWRRTGWETYNVFGSGAVHPAIGNVDGFGDGEIVLGLGEAGAGWLEVLGGFGTGFAHRAWFQVPWPSYNFSNGTTFPAAGDIDGDGRAEVVIGLGETGGGWLIVTDDAASGFATLRLLRVSWPEYNFANGETHPAVGSVDADARAEIVVGLGQLSGGGGWFETFDDGATGNASLGWRRADWLAFQLDGGATYPAVGRFR